jgi:1,4-alpha-glucan branching enzyme
MNRLLLVILACIGSMTIHAQLLTWTPTFPVENDPNQNLTITVDATKGSQGLLNYSNTGDVYVHIGVITNLSTSGSDWKYSKFTWGTTTAAAKATYNGNNKWSFVIPGSLKTFFGITNAGESIQKIAILFRNGAGSIKQANSDGSDMYIPIYQPGLNVRITKPAREPRLIPVVEQQNWVKGGTYAVQADASIASEINIYLNGTLALSTPSSGGLGGNITITTDGMQQIVAEAKAGGVTKFDTVNVFVAPTTTVAALPAGVRDGINYENDNTAVTLVLHAPGKSAASVIGDFNNWTESASYFMNKTPDGKKFWLRITGLTPGTEYGFQYKVDNNIVIADPYTQKVLDPWNDKYISAATYPGLKAYPEGKTSGIVSVLQTAQPAYTWVNNSFNRPDKKGLIIYELLVRDFVAAHDWNTIKDTLTYLKRLGVNAIEIMPFNEFEGNESWGYNSSFYFAPDKYYGTKNALKAFIDAAHSQGIAIVMDIALNHQFGQSPLVQLYWDAANNRPAANNPWFNPIATHPFNVGYDMNHESADTKNFVGRVVEHWLQEYKIDGFRFDLSKGFTQKNSGGDVNAWSVYDASRVAIWKGYYDTVQNKSPNSYVILEHFAENQEEKELSNYGMMLWGNENYFYNQASMGFLQGSDLSSAFSTVRTWDNPYLVGYMESHDEERLMFRNINFGNLTNSYNTRDTTTALKRMEQAAAFFFTVPGPKMMWQFGELGYDYPINYCTNGTIDNNCRLDKKPIRWDYYNDARRKSLFNVYSKLIALRFHPSYKAAFTANTATQYVSGLFKWIKITTDSSKLIVVGNFDVASVTGSVAFPESGVWYNYLDNTIFNATGAEQPIVLQPGEFRVYVNRNVNNVVSTPVSNVPVNSNAFEAKVYPNPAQAAFVVDVNMPQSSNVRVDVVNNVGQYVTTLQQSFLTKGAHQLSFDRNQIKAANGIYYLRLISKSSEKTIQINLQ